MQQQPPTNDQAVAWAMTMVPTLAARAVETERLRELPPATIDDAVEAGIFRLLVPTSVG
ncbi:MAG: flavin-dependent monooxygenase, partial [Actinomycetia bacterium]|nr:flavin-dependent monooxygenase [Actinomycetes bacterium]